MPPTDPIADMLTRIRNAQAIKSDAVVIPYSKIKTNLLRLIMAEGFISSFAPKEVGGKRMLKVVLRYYDDRSPVIHGLKRVSKPGLKVYSKSVDIPRYYGGLSVCFLSTSRGLMTGYEARKRKLGGELLFYIW